MTLPEFPTAPRWFRRVLQAETLAIRTLNGRKPIRAFNQPMPSRGTSLPGVENLAYNDLVGYLASERLVPGRSAGRDVAFHAARYIWALSACVDKQVLDVGCGVGYGSYLLSWVAASVTGIDVSKDAIETARSNYPGVEFRVGNASDAAQVREADIAVCFEVLEHTADPDVVLDLLAENFPRALLSFPNPIFMGSHINPHHVNDWPLTTLLRKLRARDVRKVRLFHQNRQSTQVKRLAFPWSPTWLLDIQTARRHSL